MPAWVAWSQVSRLPSARSFLVMLGVAMKVASAAAARVSASDWLQTTARFGSCSRIWSLK